MGVNLAQFAGAPDGMVRAVGQHELEDTQAWTIIDAFLNQPGLITRRAGLGSPAASVAGAYSLGLAGAVDPQGQWASLQITRRASDNAGVLEGFKNTTISETLFTGAVADQLFDSKDALGGGALIGSADDLGSSASTQQVLALWRGASLGSPAATYTPSASIARGDSTITLSSGGSNWAAGHFVFGSTSGQLIGCVKSVSGNVLTLEHPSIAAETTTVYGSAWRGLARRVSKGRITTSAASTTVNGGNTLFRALGLGSGTWDLFTTDFAYIGTVSSVTSDAQLELTTSAAVALLNADYIAIQQSGATYTSTNEVFGWINASFAGHQFYANGKTVLFSDDDDLEAVDTVNDTIIFSDDSVSALIPTEAALVVCSENEAFILAGAVGTTPDRWAGDRIHDDGCISTMTAVEYGDGAIWAGRRGVWYYAGGRPVNVVASLGEVYHRIVANLAASTRLYGMVHADHYFLHVEGTSQTDIEAVDPGASASGTAMARMTIVVNLRTGACSILRNVGVRGFAKPPLSVGSGETYFSITTNAAGTRTARVYKATDLFAENSSTGADSYLCDGESTLGPVINLESKLYDLGNPQILKLFKLLLLHYLIDGTHTTTAEIAALTADNLRVATIKGLSKDIVVSGKQFWPDPENGGVWLDKRAKFMKRSQYLGFLLFQGTSTLTQVVLGSWALGFKQKRPGRV